MAPIFKVSNEKSTPEWFGRPTAKPQFEGALTLAQAKRIVNLPDSIGPDELVEELDFMEKCAEAKATYHYSARWDTISKGRIREYAKVVSCAVAEIDPEDEKILAYAGSIPELQKKSNLEPIVKEASAVVLGGTPLVLRDPFGLDGPLPQPMSRKERDEAREKERRAEWEQIKPEAKLNSPTVLMRAGQIMKGAGGEDYEKSQRSYVKPGQNSISDWDAIENLAKSEVEDNGARLKREAKEREEHRKQEKKAWEQEIIAKNREISGGAVPEVNFRLAPAVAAQGNVFGRVDLDMPEKTTGEMIRAHNDERKAAIQREKQEAKQEWDVLKSDSRFGVSDAFAASLKAQLEKTPIAKTASVQPAKTVSASAEAHAPAVQEPTEEEIRQAQLESLKPKSNFGVSDAFAASLRAELAKIQKKS